MIFLLLLPPMFLFGFYIGRKDRKKQPLAVSKKVFQEYKTKEVENFLSYDGTIQE